MLILSFYLLLPQPSIVQTNDSPAAVPNDQKTTEVPKPHLNYVKPIFTDDFTSQRVFPSKWKDFQIDIGNILPSRDFSHVRKSFHKPYNEYGVSKYKAQNYPKYRKPIYSKSVNTPNYGFTRHRGPVYSKAVNIGHFGSLGGFLRKENKERHKEETSYFPQSRNFELNPVIQRMMQNLKYYQKYPERTFGRSQRNGNHYFLK